MGGPGKCGGRMLKCVDNFLPAKFVVNNVAYCSAENYFQAQKCTTKEEFEKVRRGGCGADVWMVGSSVKLRNDWEEVKVRVMYEGNKAKFEQNPNLKVELVATQGPITFDNSTAFWCRWNGRICELIREELREEAKDKDIIKEIWEQITEYEKSQKK
eukprot:Phypoly_transcript_24354.p1 GENE.Phypoly_transcript_24354~~Phypoly_transcript_24354.p1  ORF type:complete len:179 (+),score=33.25 Phypoly_transcript_24354:67-537(+)